MQELTQDQWRENLTKNPDAVIIDVRTDAEVDEGHIPNALHMDIFNAGPFMEKAKELDPEGHYYVYCRSGGRSGQACMILESLGFKNTYNLLGGFSEWEGERSS